jgi:hypothetical protein
LNIPGVTWREEFQGADLIREQETPADSITNTMVKDTPSQIPASDQDEQLIVEEVKPINPSITGSFMRLIRPKEKVEVEVLSIALQVNKILQQKLKTSKFKNQKIEIIETQGIGMVVVVDDQTYDGVGDVPDEEVRTFIQACVAEWESNQIEAQSDKHDLP